MKIKLFSLFLILSLQMAFTSFLEAKHAKLFRTEADEHIYLCQQYNKACELYNKEKWRRAIIEFGKVTCVSPNSEEAAEAYYYLGVSFFQLREYDLANDAFSNYLKASGRSCFFEEVVYYKFCIAEYFKNGQRKRFFKMRYSPRWATAYSMALTIYDEVTVLLPNHELAARSFYSKGELLASMGEYRESIEAYQMLIRRFPRYEFTPQSYLQIAEAYCCLARYELQNPDLLALAELNARKFKEEFPRDEKVELVQGRVACMKEMYAKGLSDIGLFYERVCKPNSAVIYYQNAIEQFPDTAIADFCRERLTSLGCEYEEEEGESCQSEETPVDSELGAENE